MMYGETFTFYVRIKSVIFLHYMKVSPAILLLTVSKRLFYFGSFGDFSCGVSLFIVIREIYKKIEMGKNRY